ncbi:MAG: prolyl oligopeptidase family serine peptidase [Bacteroidota bacterium]
MNKKIYYTGIFFTGLCMIMGLLRCLLHFQFQFQVFFRQSFLPWMIVSSAASLILLLILWKYYRYKKYRFAAGTLLVVIIAFISSFAGDYTFLTTTRMQGLSQLTQAIYSTTLAIHFISLIFSRARERRWLLIAGITGICLLIIMWPIRLMSWDNTSLQSKILWTRIIVWTYLLSELSLIFFLLNYISEIRLLQTGSGAKTIRPFEKYTMGVLGVTILAICFVFGLNLVNKKEASPTNLSEIKEDDRMAAHFFEARNYVNSSGDTMRYRLMKPLDYDPKKKYPLLVCLHHGGGNGTDNIRQIITSPVAQVMELLDNRKKYPAFLFVPQCPRGSSWGNVPGQPAMDDLVFETMASLEKEFSIDSKRRYVTGESLGGLGTWHFLCARPDLFAAGIAVSGGGDPALAKNIIHIPVWAFHGSKDKNVPVQYDRDMIAAIKKAGGHPLYTEYPDKAHNPWDKARFTPGLYDWLFAQKRN